MEINHSSVNIKEECTENENGVDENCKSNGFLYVDMNEYNENNYDGIEIKEEEEQVEYLLQEKTHSDNSEICFDGTLPLNSLKNLANHSQNDIKMAEIETTDKNKKKKCDFIKPIQKENISLKINDEINENSKSKRYTLRNRTKFQKKNSHSSENVTKGRKNFKPNKSDTNCLNFKSVNLHKSTISHNAEKKNFSCFHCGEYFSTNNSCDAHIKMCKFQTIKNDFCQKSFADGNHLNSEKDTKKIFYKCHNCEKTFKKKINLTSHISNSECNPELFVCAMCDEIFIKKTILKKHILNHLKNQIQCKQCWEKFKNIKTLKNHICSGENKIKKIYCQCSVVVENKIHNSNSKCDECNRPVKNFTDNQSLNVSYFEKSQCEICNKRFSDLLSFEKHLKNHSNDSGVTGNCASQNGGADRRSGPVKKKIRYKCDTCGKLFAKLVKLKIHILNIHQGVTYQCKKCNVKFQSEEDLDSHVNKNECKGEEVCVCKTCGKVFAKRDYLKKHQYMHMNVLFKCKYCYCAFMKEKSYKKHIEKMNCSKSARKIRMSEFNYKKCRLCEIEFETEELLIRHFKASHVGLEPHQCFCCDSCLPTFQDLQNHIHQHNIQKYTCNLCGKPYTSQEGFRKHRLKHKGAEFKCRYCCSEFLNGNRFKFHERTCKKNPEIGYEPSEKKDSKKKDSKPKQSRQLHWESRIIMKRLRGDPTSISGDHKFNTEGQQDNSITSTFFDESESETTNERGWFDNYYKTEEDDIAFGLKKPDELTLQDCNSNSDSKSVQKDTVKKNKTLPTFGVSSANNSDSADDQDTEIANNYSESSSEYTSTESESEIETTDLPIDYNPKKCRLCVISFGQEYELLHHFIKSHPGELAHKCPQCGVQSPLYAQLKEHMKTHGIGMGIFNCDNCSKQFKSEKKLSSHNIRCKGINNSANVPDIKSGSQSGDDSCKRCGKKFHTKFGYRRHKQLCKKKKKKNGEKLQTSVKLDTKESVVNCVSDEIGFQLSDPEDDSKGGSETVTENTVSSVKEKENCTKAVEKKLPEEKKKSEMKNTYSGEPPMDSFPCRLCDKKFQYERGIVMHFKTAHPGNKPLICHVCNMHLADKLKEHLKTHGIGEEFVCELCGKRFNQKFLSKIHEMWHQGIEYKCNNCKQKFLNKEKMDKHIGENRCSNRQSLMRLPCDICGKSYRSKFGLSKHYITHTPKELRPVKNRMNCEYCGKWFENNNGLQRHRRIHTGERPFCCRFCPKAFAQEGNCKAHERIHTGESKPRKKKPATVIAPSSQLPPSSSGLVSHTSSVPPFSLPSSAPDSITYPGHVTIYNYNNIDPSGIVR